MTTTKTTSELCNEIFGKRPHPDTTGNLRRRFEEARLHLEACELYERVRSAAYAGIEIGRVEGRREIIQEIRDRINMLEGLEPERGSENWSVLQYLKRMIS
jgi:hypothetical protein